MTLYVSGTVSNQGRFYPRFDAVVLLSAPLDVLLQRVEERATNGYGKSAEERAQIIRNVENVERAASHVHARARRDAGD